MHSRKEKILPDQKADRAQDQRWAIPRGLKADPVQILEILRVLWAVKELAQDGRTIQTKLIILPGHAAVKEVIGKINLVLKADQALALAAVEVAVEEIPPAHAVDQVQVNGLKS